MSSSSSGGGSSFFSPPPAAGAAAAAPPPLPPSPPPTPVSGRLQMSLVMSSELIAFTNSFGQKEATSTPDACSPTHQHTPPDTDVRYNFHRESGRTPHNSRAHAFVILRTTRIFT